MLYREIIAVCSQIHTKHINTLCGQNVECLNVKPDGVCVCVCVYIHIYIYIYIYIYSNHLFFEGSNYFNLNFAALQPPFSKLYFSHITSPPNHTSNAIHIACSSAHVCCTIPAVNSNCFCKTRLSVRSL